MAKWGEGDPRWIVEERPDATNVNNWHWTEKNASDWSKCKFKELLVGLEMNFDGDGKVSSKGVCRITEISSADGEATANNRKAKLIFFFEWNLDLKFEALLDDRKSDDEKLTGHIEIPNLSDENSADEVEVNVKMDANDQDSFAVKEIVRKKFSVLIKQALAVYIKQLKEEYSKTLILPTKQDSSAAINTRTAVARPKNNVLNSINDKPKTENDVIRGTSGSLSISETFHCGSRDLYNAFTMVEMVQAFTRGAAPEFDSKIGGSFKLFSGHIEGQIAMVYVNGSQAFKLLNGVFCIHKPQGVAMDQIVAMLKRYIIKDLNNLEPRPVKYRKKPVFVEEQNSGDLIEFGRVTAIDYSQHPLVLGPYFKECDIEIQPVQKLDYLSSGICLMAINDGCDSIKSIHESRPLKVYRAECKLGRSTLNYWENGKIIEKTTYAHVTKEKINHAARRLVGKYQKCLQEVSGAPVQSQDAFEIASRGLARPKEDSSTIIYNAKCLHLERPYFTLEMHAVNEIDEHLCGFVDDLGVRLRSSACVSSLNRHRHGVFDSDHSLLMKHWTLSNIIRNIIWCSKLLTPESLKLPHLLTTLDRTALPQLEQSKYIETIPSDLDCDPNENANNREVELLSRGFLINDVQTPINSQTRPELLLPLMERNTLDND